MTRNALDYILMLVGTIAIGAGSISFTVAASAQITPDNTLRGNERSSVPGERRRIDVGGGAVRGNNLFHSFEEFNVRRGQRVYFNNPIGIDNIFTRVTGRNPSFIRGRLGVLGDVNLFLVNPNGIVFGQFGELDVGGSFIGSTANSFQFPGEQTFSAVNPQSPPDLVRVDVPIGLQFGRDAGDITVRSNTLLPSADMPQTPPSRTVVALIGGNISFNNGVLITARDSIEIGSVGANGQVHLTPSNRGFNFTYSGDDFGNIQLSDYGVLTEGGGRVGLQAEQITVENGSQVGSTTLDRRRGGNVRVEASDTVEVRGNRSLIAADVQPRNRGDGGNLTIITDNLRVEDGAQVSTTTFGAGDGGNLTIRAANSVEVSQNPQAVVFRFVIDSSGNLVPVIDPNSSRSGLFTRSGNVNPSGEQAARATGAGGRLTIRTQELIVENAPITTDAFSEGEPGRIQIFASESVQLTNGALLSGVRNRAREVDGGNINITTGELILRDASLISVSNTRVEGAAGDINIDARFVIASPVENSDITSNAVTDAGGLVEIEAESILGLQSRDSLTSSSDITAISESGTEGTVILDTPDFDLSRGLVELPAQIIDPASLVEQRCQPGQNLALNRISITGSNPLPGVTPPDVTVSQNSIEDTNQEPYIEAQGWNRREDGKVDLEARATPMATYSSWTSPQSCDAAETPSN